jgi:hypothetical protein
MDQVSRFLEDMAREVQKRMKEVGVRGKRVNIKVRGESRVVERGERTGEKRPWQRERRVNRKADTEIEREEEEFAHSLFLPQIKRRMAGAAEPTKLFNPGAHDIINRSMALALATNDPM